MSHFPDLPKERQSPGSIFPSGVVKSLQEARSVRVAHFDCFSGISGDMTLGALIDAGVDAEAIRRGIASLGLPVELEVEKVRKGGFAATYVHVEAPAEDEHPFLPDVEAILQPGSLTPKQRDLA